MKKIVFIGRFTEYKGALNVVKAFAQVVKKTPDARLEMYGYHESHAYLDSIMGFIRLNRLQNAIKLSGPVKPEHMASKLSSGAIFINGSTDETFCMPLLEAQACGTPCVAFAAGGIPEVIVHEKTGLLAEPGDINKMADHIDKLLADKTFYNFCKLNMKSHLAKFKYDHLANDLVKHINQKAL